MAFELISYDERGVQMRCSSCGLDVCCPVRPGPGRVRMVRQLRERVGCNCPVEEGGAVHMRRGMVVFARATGEPRRVVAVRILEGEIRTCDRAGEWGPWEHVYHYARKRLGAAVGGAWVGASGAPLLVDAQGHQLGEATRDAPGIPTPAGRYP